MLSWPGNMWRRIGTLLLRRRADLRLDDELQFHIDQQIEENLAAGMSPEEARVAALRVFGNLTAVEEQTRETWGFGWIAQFAHTLRYAGRTVRRAQGFSAVAIAVMALGIGATTALFTVVRAVLLEPLPFADSSRLVRLYERSFLGDAPFNLVAGGIFAEWKKQSRGFSDLAILSTWGRELEGPEYSISEAGGQPPENVQAVRCSWNLFRLLGVEPALGRSFTAADDRPSAPATVVLSWALWQRRFGGDPGILNKPVHLNARPYTVIGIMPSWFAYPVQSVQLWTPIYHEETVATMQALRDHEFIALGRLRPGVSRAQATAELSVIVHRIHAAHPDDPFISIGANSRSLLDDMVGDIRTPLLVLLAATGCLLLIACLNVAGLLVARAAVRRRERAIRMAIGGSRTRLLVEHLSESLVLSAAGGALGLAFADFLVQWFIGTRRDMIRVAFVHMDAVVMVFALTLVFLCTFFAGMTSWGSAKDDRILGALRESSRSHSPGRGRVRLRKWLVALETTLTVVLLVSAGLLLKSYSRLRSSDLGCITNNVLTLRMTLPKATYARPEQRTTFFETLLEQVRSVPGVRAAGLVSAVPGQGYEGDSDFTITEHPPLPAGAGQYAVDRWADPGYFAALGIPHLGGRTFAADQRLERAGEVVVSESFVRQFFPGEDPLGKHLRARSGHTYQVVGVVGDTRYLVSQPAVPIMYFPILQGNYSLATLAVRSTRDVRGLALPIERIVHRLDPELAVADVLTMSQLVGQSTLNAGFDAVLLLAFAISSLVLAATGLFGVLSYIVTQRTAEIGIRVALGAQRGEVLRLMLSDGLRPVAAGLLLGLGAGLIAAQAIRTLLYGVQPFDASIFALVSLILLAVAAAASWLPAWRASRLDPLQCLRNE